MQRDRRATLRLALLLAAGGTSACAPAPGHHGPPPPPVFEEREPNDSPFAADFLGGIDPTSHFFVEGHVECAGYDVYDHFELVADEALTVRFWLESWVPGADVDLCLVDPDTGEIVACYDSPWDTESGSFTVDWPGKRFVLLVEAWDHDTGYTLEISGDPHPGYGPLGGAEEDPAALGLSVPGGAPAPQKEAHGPLAPSRRPAVRAALELE